MADYDAVIIGVGIAGASVAYTMLSHNSDLKIMLLEQESIAGYHSTGRSAAIFREADSHEIVSRLARASKSFLEEPDCRICERSFLSPRGVLYLAGNDGQKKAREFFDRWQQEIPELQFIDSTACCRLQPLLNPDYVRCAVYEPGAMEIDVNELHQCYLRGVRIFGGIFKKKSEVLQIWQSDDIWHVRTTTGSFSTERIVNCAGAWADVVAVKAGLTPLGLTPTRRTIAIVELPPDALSDAPFILDISGQFYFKPESGRLLLSPADETPTEPGDVRPDDLDIAVAIERLQRVTTLTVRRVSNKWAGLRSFFPDRAPVIGEDPRASNFFWVAGLGGYGIKTAPAVGKIASSLILSKRLPDDVAVTMEEITPERFL